MEGPAAQPEESRSFIRSRTFIALVIIAVILVLLWVASELVIPPVASRIAENEIRSRYPEAQDVSVSIKAFPALKVAFKKYDNLEVKVGQVTLQGVKFDSIDLESEEWPSGDFTALIGQDEITRFFSVKNSYIIDPVIALAEGAIVVTGKINVGGTTVTVNATGQLDSVDGRRVFFRPDELQVAGIAVPAEGIMLVRQIMERDPVFTVREDLPYTITAIKSENGKLAITGKADLEKALNVSL